MCFVLYIGTHDLLPTEEWSGEKLRPYFSELSKEDEVVRSKFSKTHVYYAGSWQGCGCGWFSDDTAIETEEDKEGAERTKETISDLRLVIEGLLEKQDTVELFLCREGSQSEEPRRRIVLTPENIDAGALPMEELDFAEVTIEKGPSNKALQWIAEKAGSH